MEKYYTPAIEEFHVGFECEYAEYLKGLRDLNWDTSTEEDFGEFKQTVYEGENILTFGRRGMVRVKYLDTEDIESLGFHYDGAYNWFSSKSLAVIHNAHVIIKNNYCEKMLEVILLYGNSSEEVVFSGIIKNKSELKKLLKQIGYEV